MADSPRGPSVAVHDLGGAGPPLLFAHATGFHGLVWTPVAVELADDFSCYALDERGHGNTPAPVDANFDWEGFGEDVLTAVATLGLDAPFGVGHSAGGVALLLAELASPGTFRNLFCYEPVIFPFERTAPFPGGSHPLAVGARRRRDIFESRDVAYDNYRSKPPFSALRADALRAYVDYGFEDLPDGTVRLKCRPENEALVYEMGGTHTTFERLGDVEVEVTIVGGELADTFTPDIITRQAAALRHGRTEVLPGLGHFGPMQDPVAVAAAIRRAFAGTLSG